MNGVVRQRRTALLPSARMEPHKSRLRGGRKEHKYQDQALVAVDVGIITRLHHR